jgi:hypothetical protein
MNHIKLQHIELKNGASAEITSLGIPIPETFPPLSYVTCLNAPSSPLQGDAFFTINCRDVELRYVWFQAYLRQLKVLNLILPQPNTPFYMCIRCVTICMKQAVCFSWSVNKAIVCASRCWIYITLCYLTHTSFKPAIHTTGSFYVCRVEQTFTNLRFDVMNLLTPSSVIWEGKIRITSLISIS